MSFYNQNQYGGSNFGGTYLNGGTRNFDLQSLNFNSYKPLRGKMINSLDDITNADIPNDGSIAYFPASDNSCIIAKGWAKGGDRIETEKYIPESSLQQQNQQPTMESIMMNMLERISVIEGMLSVSQQNFDQNQNMNGQRQLKQNKKYQPNNGNMQNQQNKEE